MPPLIQSLRDDFFKAMMREVSLPALRNGNPFQPFSYHVLEIDDERGDTE
jgi:hypothetical protein